MQNTLTESSRFADLPLISGKTFTLFVLFFTVVMEALISELGFPPTIRYINDFLILILLMTILVDPAHLCAKVGGPVICVTLLLLLTFSVSSIINGVKPLLYLWAFRNTFRGFIFFFACVRYLKKDDLPGIMDALLALQIISFFLVIYQHFVLGLNMDETGGLFGHGNGAGLNPFNALLFAYYLNVYLSGNQSLRKLAVALITSLLIAAIAEEKITFVLFSVIALVSFLLTKASGKLIVALLISLVALTIGLNVLRTLYPSMFEILTSFDAMNQYLTGTHETGYVLPRIGSFSVIKNMFFGDSLLKNLFGVGFGNGETSSFTFLVGPYYVLYGFLNYRWFSHQWVFLECGYLGFYCYLAFFVIVLLTLLARRRAVGKDELPYLTCSAALVVCVIISIWYNATLKVDMCYLSFFSIAIGFVVMRAQGEGEA